MRKNPGLHLPCCARRRLIAGQFAHRIHQAHLRIPEGHSVPLHEKMPEEMRIYGQDLGHLADAQYLFRSKLLDEKNPEPKIEQNKSSKSDLHRRSQDSLRLL